MSWLSTHVHQSCRHDSTHPGLLTSWGALIIWTSIMQAEGGRHFFPNFPGWVWNLTIVRTLTIKSHQTCLSCDYDKFWKPFMQLWQILVVVTNFDTFISKYCGYDQLLTLVSCVVIWQFFKVNFRCFNISKIWNSERLKNQNKTLKHQNEKYEIICYTMYNSFNFIIGVCNKTWQKSHTVVVTNFIIGVYRKHMWSICMSFFVWIQYFANIFVTVFGDILQVW